MHASSSGLRSRRFSKKENERKKLRAITKNKEEEEWAHLLLNFAHFYAHPMRTPSLACLLARLFDLPAWKRKGLKGKGCHSYGG